MKNQLNTFVKHETMKAEFVRILEKHGFTEKKADLCAEIFMINSLEGIYSHGVNRFSRFIKYIEEGYIKTDAEPSLVHSAGSLEQWDGNLGPGPLNATIATSGAIRLARENGIGMVTLANTNHWMRGGTYGWQAAREGCVFIGWTNTDSNMPPWGATNARLGNNPLVFAVPYKDEAIVLDFAMSQFSYGKMETYKMNDTQLPFPGGYNKNGELSNDPGQILETQRTLPIGYWKGAGLSLLLDILAAVLSGGLATHKITKTGSESCLSQVFIAVDLKKLSGYESIKMTINDVIEDLKKSNPVDDKAIIRYPGESVVNVRNENLKNGIPVNKKVWEKILSL